MRLLRTSYFPAVIWFIVLTTLFVLPGNQFPQEDWLDVVQIDKIIHTFLMAATVVLFSLPLQRLTRSIIGKVAAAVIVYGIIIEFIQHYFIPQRSFEFADIVCDAAGALVGYYVIIRWLQKK